MTKMTVLGTGHAITTKCYNTCFALENENGIFLVDGGGGNGILTQAENAGLELARICHLFVTHAHTDHLLGSLWAVRAAAEAEREEDKYVYGHDIVIELLERYVQDLFNRRQRAYVEKYFHFVTVGDGEKKNILGMDITFFDILSKKAKQYGFTAALTDGKRFTCLGDEPYAEHCEKYAKDSDWLTHEAFCLYEDRDIFHPYEISHSTAKDAGISARKLSVKNLVMYHTEDTDLKNRRERYTKEAQTEFDGNIFVPDDLDVIIL